MPKSCILVSHLNLHVEACVQIPHGLSTLNFRWAFRFRSFCATLLLISFVLDKR